MTNSYTFPAVSKHGDIQEVFNGVYFVTGGCKFKGPVPMQFSRNMTILKEGSELTIINSIRLNEAGLQQLDSLGQVKNIIRLAGFHGMDDPFYKDRYAAKVWSVNAPYARKLEQPVEPADVYFEPDVLIDGNTPLPLEGAKLYSFESTQPGEALLLLNRNKGILVSGDCLQNWVKTDKYFSFFAKIMMKKMGFIKPHNIGPGWLKFAKPDVQEVKGILDLDFDNVLPAHGEPVIGNAKSHYQSSINKL